ncbi:MAG: DnaJ domain-containing protein, partial [Dehalococcoidales bacterium]|nr:DnaJ domain-containing protein [Dehalococcoidales bacterium]
MEEKQYYKILGVPRDANEKDIKRAYKTLLKKYDPKKNPGNEDWAEKRRVELVEAYDTLSNPEARTQYDAIKTPAAATAPQPRVITTGSGLVVKPAHVRTAPAQKKARGEENRAETKAQEALAEKKKRRNTIFVIA